MAIFNMVCLLLFAVGALVRADMYLHNPRGSNNRLNENGRERRNGNRLFDSQNNNRGGYNVGNLYYYAGSVLPIQWTNQHSCSDPNNNCELVIQYMCGNLVRDGTSTRTIPDNINSCTNKECSKDMRYGMHEDYAYYTNCKNRERNKGLFTADQKLKGNAAKYTRQNAAGTRRGYECPEERDYYPYWQPSPWKDIVVMTNDISKCNYYKQESQNVKSRFACEVPSGYLWEKKWGRMRRKRNVFIPIQKDQCEKIEGATWKEHPAHGIPAPDCRKTMWSRDNHHGNGIGGFMNTYNWTVPDMQKDGCVMRIRYNISTNDFNTWNTFSDKNGDGSTKVDISSLVGLTKEAASQRGYTFKNNPEIQVLSGSSKFKLRLAINTAQYGRTFQDRSHVFEIRKRKPELAGKKIYNLNVRGKRGNIVQNYPAVEYDFVPNRLSVESGDYVHFQWTGSNSNPGNNAGQGRAGTDRSNVVLLQNQIYAEGQPKQSMIHGQFGRNYPQKLLNDTILGFSHVDAKKLALIHPGAGEELNEAGTHFDLGPRKVTGTGVYHYMCTRNNNFSNRSQKGKIVVSSTKSKRDENVKKDVASDIKKEWKKRVSLQNSKRKNPEDMEAWGKTKKEVSKSVVQQLENEPWIRSMDLNNGQSDLHKAIRVEEISNDEGEKMLKTGASFGSKDPYASNHFAVYPMTTFSDADSQISVELKLKKDLDPEYVTVYHSPDLKNWYPVENQDIQDSKALVKIKAGGLYVARVAKSDQEIVLKDMPEYNHFFTAQ